MTRSFEESQKRLAQLNEKLKKRGENVTPEKIAGNVEKAGEIFVRRGEENRNKLLAGIDPEIIASTREKCKMILLDTEVKDFEEAEKLLDETIRTIPPRTMVPALFSATKHLWERDPVFYAKIANAFLAMTEDY